MKNPLVSIIIPTYNEEEDIAKCLNSLINQTYSPLEIIIVDDGSTDNTSTIIKQFKHVKIVEGKHKGPGFSRNLGAKQAKGEILVFVDADMFFDKGYISTLTEPIRNRKSIGTEEKIQYSSNPENIWSRCWGSYAKENLPNRGHIFRAILRDKFLELGGFDSKYGYADDMTLFLKHSLQSEVVEKAFCYHKNPPTLKEVYGQSRWIGASLTNFFTKNEVLKYFTPLFMILFSPIVIPGLSIIKCIKIKNFKILFPWMIIFMFVRYFGTINGLIRNIYFKNNVR